MEFKNLRCASFVWLLFFLTVFSCANAEENMTEPRRNVNMNPTQQWRSAVECMYNKSVWCTEQQQLSLNLTIQVSQDEMAGYCEGGCLDHTMAVLDCIHDVHRHFWFANDFDTWTLRKFLTDRCANLTGFSYKDIHSGAIQVSRKMVLSMIIPLFALVYINNFQYLM